MSDLRARSITSVIVCHFMLSLRQFDSAVADSASAAYSVHVSRIRVQELERTASELTAHHQSATESHWAGDSTRLPAFISSFAQPVHLNTSDTSGNYLDSLVESDAVERTSRRKTHPRADPPALAP